MSSRPTPHQRLMRRFAEAWTNADFKAMKDMMAESATLVGDGGGIVTSLPETDGRWRAHRTAALRRHAAPARTRCSIELAPINGRLGVLRYFGGELESAQSFDTDGEHITHIYVQRNPEKLRALPAITTSAPQLAPGRYSSNGASNRTSTIDGAR